MPALQITSTEVTEPDLAGTPETVRIYSAVLDGKPLADKWVVPTAADDAVERGAFRDHLIAQGFAIA